MFSEASFSHSVHREEGVSPLDRDPPGQRPPGQRHPLDRDPPWTETSPCTETFQTETLPDRDPPRQRPSQTETLPDRDPPRQRPSQTETPRTEISLDRDPLDRDPLKRDPPLQRLPPRQRPPGQTLSGGHCSGRYALTGMHSSFCNFCQLDTNLTGGMEQTLTGMDKCLTYKTSDFLKVYYLQYVDI